MFKAGIVEPAKVTRSALQNAASIAALFLTTEAVVADKPEKAAATGWRHARRRHGLPDNRCLTSAVTSRDRGACRQYSWAGYHPFYLESMCLLSQSFPMSEALAQVCRCATQFIS